MVQTARPPHARRLIRLAEAQGEEVRAVAFWGWKGSCARELVRAVAGARGPELSADSGPDEAERIARQAGRRKVRWIVAEAAPPQSLAAAARRLAPGQAVIFATRRRPPRLPGLAPEQVAVVGPQAFLLTVEEMEELIQETTGSRLGGSEAARLRAWSDGWYAPARLACGARETGKRNPARSPDGPDVDAFLRRAVAELAPPVAAVLPELALLDEVDLAVWRLAWHGERGDRRWRALLELVANDGLVVGTPPCALRLPRPLIRFLRSGVGDREAGGVRPPDRLALSAALLRLGRPLPALEVCGAVPEAAGRVLEAAWAELLACPAERVRGALEPWDPGLLPPAGRFLRGLALAMVGRREAVAALPDAGISPELRAAAVVAAGALRAIDGAGAAEGGALDAVAARVPVALAPVLELLAGRSDGPSRPDPEDLEAAGEPEGSVSLAAELLRRTASALVGRRAAEGEPGRVAYRLRLFGRPAVYRRGPGGTEVEVRLRLRREAKLLAFLALAPGGEADRDELVEALWKEGGGGRRGLHALVSSLRSSLEARGGERAVSLEGGAYRLDRAVAWEADGWQFRRLAALGGERLAAGDPAAAVEGWRRAWSLVRGPLLAGWYEPWAVEARDRYAARYLRLLQDLGEALVRLGRLHEGLDAFRALLAEDPLNESVHVEAMRIYAVLGRRDLVHRQFAKLGSLLRSELGVEPAADTRAAYQELMR